MKIVINLIISLLLMTSFAMSTEIYDPFAEPPAFYFKRLQPDGTYIYRKVEGFGRTVEDIDATKSEYEAYISSDSEEDTGFSLEELGLENEDEEQDAGVGEKSLEDLGFVIEDEDGEKEEVDPFWDAVLVTTTVACFNEGTNAGPFMFEITGSEIIEKNDNGEIRERYKVTHRTREDWLLSFKIHYTTHFTATQEHYKSERELDSKLTRWGTTPVPQNESDAFFYMWFEFLSFDQKTLQMRWEAKNLIGKDQDFRESIHIIKRKCVIIPKP